MKLLEYKAKEIMEQFGIPTMKGVVIDSLTGIPEKIKDANLKYPVVIKAQVQIGGRGKAGGIQFAANAQEATDLCKKMLHMDIRGLKANQLMIVEKANPIAEWYISILLDRLSKSPLLIFSPVGGMDIEETARLTPEKIAKVAMDPFRGVQDYTIDYAMDVTGADKQYRGALKDIATKLLKTFYANYTMLIEINPLVIDECGALIALDGKVEIDDNALFKLPDIVEFRSKLQEDARVVAARDVNFHFVPIEEDGSIGVMSNGSGMLMSCIDLISKKGMKVGAALDLGGGATAERIKQAVEIVLSDERIHTVFICVFGGITRCDEVAKGACLAMAEQPENKKVILRIEGTNKEQAGEIVRASCLPIQMADGIPQSVELLWKMQKEA
ncbi:MAG: ATP-grasp domain-containing protein [Eubacteriales bacterium]